MLAFSINKQENENKKADDNMYIGKMGWGKIEDSNSSFVNAVKGDNDIVYCTVYDKVWGYKDILKSYPYEIEDDYSIYTINDRKVYIIHKTNEVIFFGKEQNFEKDELFYQSLKLKLNDNPEYDLSNL